MISFEEKDFLLFARYICDKIYFALKNFYKEKLILGRSVVEYENKNENDIKGTHKVDILTKNIILETVNNEFPYLKEIANIYMEGLDHSYNRKLDYCIFIDPVDGSRSADQHIGFFSFTGYSLKLGNYS
ncbi:MAG: hypothetical protein PWP31_1572 [Clostridia bacterium]|nr:hypothetical protein [Clostridia bacterium]